jgi:hypothetical protein
MLCCCADHRNLYMGLVQYCMPFDCLYVYTLTKPFMHYDNLALAYTIHILAFAIVLTAGLSICQYYLPLLGLINPLPLSPQIPLHLS